MEKRKGEVQSDSGIPDPPEMLQGEALVMWGRIMGDNGYVKALRQSHWEMVAMYCQMWKRYVEGEKSNEPVAISHIAAMINLGGKLGRNPSDQTKVFVPDTPKAANPWQELKAGS